jgi:hypothetical protein
MLENGKRKKKSTPRLLAAAPEQYCKPWRSGDTGSQQSMSMDKCIRVYVLGGRAGAG